MASSSISPKVLSRNIRPSVLSSVLGESEEWLRKVATSIISRPKRIWTRRKRRPIIRLFLKSERNSSGVASVATSKSLGCNPSSRSRTPPPTRQARKPELLSRYKTFNADSDIDFLDILCLVLEMIANLSEFASLSLATLK